MTIRLSAIAFLCGILLVQQLPTLPQEPWRWLVPLVLLMWVPLPAGWSRYRRGARLPLVFLAAGVLWVTWQAGAILADRLPAALEGKDLWVEGVVADIPRATEHGVRFDLVVQRAVADDAEVRAPCRIQLSSYGSHLRPRVGERWAMWVRLKRPHGFQNPGGFDYEGHLFHRRIGATGYVRDAAGSRLIAPGPGGYRVGRFRQQLSERIRSFLPDEAFAGVITAFANGDQSGIDLAQWQVLRRTGTIHLVAISGMHIGLVAGLTFFLLRWLWSLPGVTVLVWPAPKVAAVGAMLAALGYAALAGFAIPTQRALVMLAVVLGGVLLNRRVQPSALLALALLAVLVLDPLSVMAAGFWLSFGAVAVILFAIHGRHRAADWHGRLWAWGRVQWAVTLGLLPLMLLLFRQASLSAPFANLLAIPVIELAVIPATLLGVVVSTLLPDAVAAWPFQFAAWLMRWLWSALAPLAQFSVTQWEQHTPPAWALACALVGILVLLAPRGWPGRWVGAVWLLPLFLVRPAGPQPGELDLTLLDVGQGLAAVVRTAGHVLVYDTGARYSERFDAGRAVVAPYLRHAGVARVDMLLVSHGDNDHIGGAASLREDMSVLRVLSSVPERLGEAEHCVAGQTWTWDGVRFDVIHPPPRGAFRGNNASCVLRVQGAHGTVLLPGDIAAPAESALLQAHGETLKADVVVAPHHGSKTSSTETFLAAVRPSAALFPVGYRNRYHHPSARVLERYRRRGVRLLDSPTEGAITVRVAADGIHMSGYRSDRRRYWYAD